MTDMAVVPARPHSRPDGVRRIPAPVLDPPYDDELARRAAPAGALPQGSLALRFALPSGLPAVPPVPPREAPRMVEPADDDFFGPRATPREALPDPRRIAGRLAQAICEVVHGARPAAQLLRWTSEPIYADLERRLTRCARAGAPGSRGLRAGTVRSLHVSEPTPGVAEVCALVRRGPRTLALALRLEGIDGRWQCTAVDFD
jgi:uncharacterized protein DUF6459